MAKDKKRGFFSWLGFGKNTKEKSESNTAAMSDEGQSSQVDNQSEYPELTQTSDLEIQSKQQANDNNENTNVVNIENDGVINNDLSHHGNQATQPKIEEYTTDSPVTGTIHTPLSHDKYDNNALTQSLQYQSDSGIDATSDKIVEIAETQVPLLDSQSKQATAIFIETTENFEKKSISDDDSSIVDTESGLTQQLSETQQITQEKPARVSFFARLKQGLLKTRQNVGFGFLSLFRGKRIDDDLFDELEEQLLIADIGVNTTRKIINSLTQHANRKQLKDAEALYSQLRDEMAEILHPVSQPLDISGHKPFVILMVGVNGVGKTTTIGKLARQFQQQGKSVMLAAGDTFRAAAVEQLQIWGQRNNIPVVAQHTGADSASVIYDAIQAAQARQIDVLIADTAGRLQNKANLMEELKKIVRVLKKLDEHAPHEIMLTIDAGTGQNAVSQVKLFHEAIGLSGIALTKLDGTAKGGVIFAIADQFSIPIRYIGVGESIEDLRPFNADDFIEALFTREE